MAVLIDPPAWPAHERLWSHLVSDRSLAELHAFAARLEVPRRGFDLDHYDVAADRYDDAVRLGAEPVGGKDLARRLLGSGLRVPGRDRPPLQALRRRWGELAPDTSEIGDDLLVRWREPHRVYHGPRHLTEALDAAAVLLDAGTVGSRSGAARIAGLALWFHDAVHEGTAGQDEEDSAALAEQALAGTGVDADAPEVAALVRVTAHHDPGPSDRLGAVVSDADLAILAAEPGRYAEYARQVRAEYAHVPDGAFRAGRAAVLDALLGAPSLYRTAHAREHWEARARENVEAEHAALRGVPG